MGCGMSCMSDLLLCLTRSLPVFPSGRVQRGRSIGVAGRPGWPRCHMRAPCMCWVLADEKDPKFVLVAVPYGKNWTV